MAIDALADKVLSSKIARYSSAKSVTWDCDDLVFLDFAGLRIALHEQPERGDRPGCICLGVGPVPGQKLPKFLDSAHIAQALSAQFNQGHDPAAVLWHEDSRDLSPDVMDDFNEEVEHMLAHLHRQIDKVCAGAPSPEPRARSTRKSALSDEIAMQKLRAQLRAKGSIGSAISAPLHASIYLMAFTFFFTIPALGSALFSYIALRDGMDKPSSEA